MNPTLPNTSTAAAWLLAAAILSLLPATGLEAALTTLRYFRLGENDPGAIPEGAVFQGTDQTGAPALQVVGTPVFAGQTADTAALRTGSALGLLLDGGTQALWQLDAVATPAENFGLELWVKPQTTPEGFSLVVYNGDTRANGWGIYQNGGTFGVSYGGRERFGETPAVVGEWVHLALVNEGGTSTFFVNGTSVASTSTPPLEPQGGFAIGAHPQPPLGEFFTGWVDEVRVFTFDPGTFDPRDLLIRQQAQTREATAITSTSAVLHGSLIPEEGPVQAWFEFGEVAGALRSTPAEPMPGGAGPVQLSVPMDGLLPGTLYRCRTVSSNAVHVARGVEITFRTRLAVTSLEDDGPGSLRQALRDATPGETIEMLAEGTITLTNSSLVLAQSVSLIGTDPLTHVLDGGDALRLIIVRPGAVVTLTGLTLQHGHAPDGGPSAFGGFGFEQPTEGEGGGGILNQGTATLSRCILRGNRAGNGGGYRGISFFGDGTGREGGAGGAIFNEGDLTLESCLLIQNTGGAGGRGSDALSGGSSEAHGSAGGQGGSGGAVLNRASAVFRNTSLIGNQGGPGGTGGNGPTPQLPWYRSGPAGGTGEGGAILNQGILEMVQCTVSRNATGIASRGATAVLDMTACTVVSNAPSLTADGGGILNGTGGSRASLRSCLVGQNGAGPVADLAGPFTSSGYNVVGAADPVANGLLDTAHADRAGTPAQPLALRMGPLLSVDAVCQVHVPTVDSPAIDSGDDSLLDSPTLLVEDQCLRPRQHSLHVDAGAVEFDGAVPSASATALGASLPDGPDPVTGTRTVVLEGIVNPGGNDLQPFFLFGTTTGYGGRFPAGPVLSGRQGQPVTLRVGGLVPGFTYHYSLGISNAHQAILDGDRAFTVPAARLPGDADGDGAISGAELQAVLALYWGNPAWVRMTNVAGLGGTNVTFELPGVTSGLMSVESSTDLANWEPTGPALPRFGFIDTNAPAAGTRFYRLRMP